LDSAFCTAVYALRTFEIEAKAYGYSGVGALITSGFAANSVGCGDSGAKSASLVAWLSWA